MESTIELHRAQIADLQLAAREQRRAVAAAVQEWQRSAPRVDLSRSFIADSQAAKRALAEGRVKPSPRELSPSRRSIKRRSVDSTKVATPVIAHSATPSAGVQAPCGALSPHRSGDDHDPTEE